MEGRPKDISGAGNAEAPPEELSTGLISSSDDDGTKTEIANLCPFVDCDLGPEIVPLCSYVDCDPGIPVDYLCNNLHCSGSVMSTTSSADSQVCRICQLTALESGMSMDENGCDCRGSLRLYHRSCAEHWMSMQGSDICEICRKPYGYRLSRQYRFVPFQRHRNSGRWPPVTEYVTSVTSYCSDTRRIMFFILMLLLTFPIGNSIALSTHAYYEMTAASTTHNETNDLSNNHSSFNNINTSDTNELLLAYELSIWLTCAIVVLTVIAFGLWLFCERYLIPQERLFCKDLRIFRITHARFLDSSTHSRYGSPPVTQQPVSTSVPEIVNSIPQLRIPTADVDTETDAQMVNFTVGSF